MNMAVDVLRANADFLGIPIPSEEDVRAELERLRDEA